MFGRAPPIPDPRKIDLDSIFYLNDYSSTSSTVNLISQIYQIGGVAQGVLHQTLVELRKITHDTHYREKTVRSIFPVLFPGAAPSPATLRRAHPWLAVPAPVTGHAHNL